MNNSKKHLALLSVLLCLLLIAFSGCTPVEHLQSDYQIVTSFYPMYLFTRNLTEGISGVTVVNMTAQNAGCLHDYQLLSKDMKALGAADAFVINGAGAAFLKPLYDSIIQRYAQLEKVPESALVLLIKKAAACGSRDRKNSFNHCIKIKFLSPDYKAQNPKIDTKHEASQ